MVEVKINGISYRAEPGILLGDLLSKACFNDSSGFGCETFGMPCGGHGRCGKCRVLAKGELSLLSEPEKRLLSREEIERGVRLACCTTVEGDCTVKLRQHSGEQIQGIGDMPDFVLKPAFQAYGFVLDVGTTTLAARLYDTKGMLLAEGSRLNPQINWGADVISRIESDLRGEGRSLRQAVCKAVDGLLEELSAKAGIDPEEIDGLVITGNTVMLHLLTGTSTEPLSHAPFTAKRLFGETVRAETLGLSYICAPVYLAPCAAAFVGADLVTAVLAAELCDTLDTKLLVDIGTNGEMALWHKGELYCCSTAAGPAFEGAGISMGMGGSNGAIDSVFVRDGVLTSHVIGDIAPMGICGSGVVDTVSCLLETGQMDDTGYLEEACVTICEPVIFTQNDVRMVQLAKSAIHAGIRTLLHTAGLTCTDVQKFFIAGGFGSYLNVENGAKIGLFPEEMLPNIRVIGNAALSGASMLLLNIDYRNVGKNFARHANIVELSMNPFFADEYMNRMLF